MGGSGSKMTSPVPTFQDFVDRNPVAIVSTTVRDGGKVASC